MQSPATKAYPRRWHRTAATALVCGCALVFLSIPGRAADSVDDKATDARRFVEMQREARNSMLTGQSRLERACSVPVVPSATRRTGLPDLNQIGSDLVSEADRFYRSAREREQAAEMNRARQCQNPITAVLELFGSENSCTEAKADAIARRRITEAAKDWGELLRSQLKILADARALERRGCLSAGFTAKLTEAYVDSLRPAGTSLRVVFDRWTSRD